MRKLYQYLLPLLVFSLAPAIASAQSFRVQCPASTLTHPDIPGTGNSSDPAYNGPTQLPFFAITNITVSGTTATATVAGTLGLPTSTSIPAAVRNVAPAGFNGPVTVTITGPSTFTYPVPAGLVYASGGYVTSNINGAIRCQQISGGDGLMTEADGTQTFMFSFGPLSGLADVAGGLPSTQFPGGTNGFNTPWPGCTSEANCASPLVRGDPAATDGATSGAVPWATNPATTPKFTWNGAVGLTSAISTIVTVSDLVEGVFPVTTPPTTAPGCPAPTANTVTAWTDAPLGLPAGSQVVISNATAEGGTTTPPGYANNGVAPVTPPTWTITCVTSSAAQSPGGFIETAFQYVDTNAGLASDTGNDKAAIAAAPVALDGHVDPREIMDIGVMNGNIPAPLSQINEDDEFFLTLTNVGMIMRPDLFEQHTVHFHGYPNASSFYDGVPDASIAINIGASFTYYYLAPDAGTYFWHCHITPPEHLQMGMVGQIHIRPRQDRVPQGGNLYAYLGYQNGNLTGATGTTAPAQPLPAGTVADLRTECNPGRDILCSATMPSVPNAYLGPRTAANPESGQQGLDLVGNPQRYTYNDGDGSTAYDVEYPIQMHGFDPNFHFVGMTFNPELFVDMKDKYFLLNGRGYPDTVGLCGSGGGGGTTFPAGCVAGPQATITTDGAMHYSQPLPTVINIPVGGKALLRMVNLSVTEYHTLQSVGIPMKEVGFMAKLLRDQAGNNTEFYTNSITLGGGESLDVILDASDDGCSAFAGSGCSAKLYPAGSTFYLYTPQLDHLSNDAENFGGMMTEVHICKTVVPAGGSNYAGSTFGNTCN